MKFYDILPLPSEGYFYKNKQDRVKVEYLTTEDQLLLTSPNIINLGEVIPYILENKVMDFPNFNDLILQDANNILFYLRELAIGDTVYYSLNEKDIEINFNDFEIKSLLLPPDEDGTYTYMDSESQLMFLYSPITFGEFRKYEETKTSSNHDTLYYSTIIRKIIVMNEGREITGQVNIENFIKKIRRGKYAQMKESINKMLDFGFKFESSYDFDGTDINIKIKLDDNFFNCSLDTYLEFRQLIFKEINILVTDGHYGYSDILKMPSHHRRENKDALMESIKSKIKHQEDVGKSKN